MGPANATDNKRRILLGHIAGAHGIRGDVVIKAYTEAPGDIASYGPLTSEDGRRQFELRVVNVTPKGVVARVKGVSDRNGAEALKGCALYVDRDRLPAAEDGAFYYEDLVGLQVFAPDGAEIGRITAVHNFGAGDLIEVAPPGGGKSDMVPFTDACVPTVDIAGRRVVVVMPVMAPVDEPGAQSAERPTADEEPGAARG